MVTPCCQYAEVGHTLCSSDRASWWASYKKTN